MFWVYKLPFCTTHHRLISQIQFREENMKFSHLCQKYVLDNGHLGGPSRAVGCHWSHQSPLSDVIVPGVSVSRTLGEWQNLTPVKITLSCRKLPTFHSKLL
jgi:hypothetical protein